MRTTVVVVAALAGCGDNAGLQVCSETPGNACVWAGKSGIEGFNGDGLHRLDTELYWTMDMKFASDGSVWFIDWNNHLVRRVLEDDTVESVVGWIDPIFPGDGVPGTAERTAEGAPGLDVKLNHPTDLVETDDGKILVMAWHNHKLREIDPATGRVRIVAGAGAGFAGDGMPLAQTLFRQPKGLERDAAGNLYILDQANFRVRKIDKATGMISTIAGNGMQGYEGDGGMAVMAKLNFEAGSNPEPSGGLAVRDGKVYVADTLSNRIRVVDTQTGMIELFAGTGVEGGAGDGGPALAAQLAHPRDMEFGPDGNLYVADTDNNRIRMIDMTTRTITTVAGSGELGLDPTDDLPATQMKLKRPFNIDFDPAGNLFIADTINSRYLKVYR
ncbi:MAG: hypothetical protein JNL83_27025 [Myxococcales bacterium]|nr:hypothetical protein [Myxococcales bacterium]